MTKCRNLQEVQRRAQTCVLWVGLWGPVPDADFFGFLRFQPFFWEAYRILDYEQGRQGQLSGNAKLCQKARTLGLGKQLMENFFWDGSKQENEGVNIHLPVILMLHMLAIGLGLMPKIFVRVGYLRTMPEKWEKQASMISNTGTFPIKSAFVGDFPLP